MKPITITTMQMYHRALIFPGIGLSILVNRDFSSRVIDGHRPRGVLITKYTSFLFKVYLIFFPHPDEGFHNPDAMELTAKISVNAF